MREDTAKKTAAMLMGPQSQLEKLKNGQPFTPAPINQADAKFNADEEKERKSDYLTSSLVTGKPQSRFDDPNYSETVVKASDHLPKVKFPQYRTGEGTYGDPVEYNGNPIESSSPYKVVRSEVKDGTYYHFVDQLPTRKLTPGETDVAAGILGLPIGAYSSGSSAMATGFKYGSQINPIAGEIGGFVGALGGAIYGGATGYDKTKSYLENNYHHPILSQGNHVFIENETHDFP